MLWYVTDSAPTEIPGGIEHFYWLVGSPDLDGGLQDTAKTSAPWWHSGQGSAVSLPLNSITSNAEGPKTINPTASMTVPAAPSSPPPGREYTGVYRTQMDMTSIGNITYGTNSDWGVSAIHLGTSAGDPYTIQTFYPYGQEIFNEGKTLLEQASYPDTFNVNEHVTRVYIEESGTPGSDMAGETIWFQVDAEAYDSSETGNVSVTTSIQVHAMWQDAEYDYSDVGDWSSLQSSTDAVSKENDNGTLRGTNVYVNGSPTDDWRLTRSWFWFESLGAFTFDLDTRLLQDADLRIFSQGDDEFNSEYTLDVVVQEGTQVGSGGILALADFDAFSGPSFGTKQWQFWAAGNENPENILSLNTAGKSFISTQMAADTDLKLCIRDYRNDYQNVELITYNSNMLVGMWYATSTTYPPRMKMTYSKLADWGDYTDDSFWQANTTETWVTDHWNSADYDGGEGLDYRVHLLVFSGGEGPYWEDGYLPAGKMKVTSDVSTTMDIELLDAAGNHLADVSGVSSEDIIDLEWWATGTNGEIAEIIIYNNIATEAFDVTAIEFLEI